MSRSHLRLLSVALLIGCVIIVGSCTKDDIPVTPAGPFLFTNLRIAKTLTPVPGNNLTRSTLYKVKFVVDYTLAPNDELQKANRGILADVYFQDTTGTVTVLSTMPTAMLTLLPTAGAIAESLTFTVPANKGSVTLEAYIDTIPSVSFVLTLDDKTWPVQ